jgi:23S rRNA pseudouridine2605 synthase
MHPRYGVEKTYQVQVAGFPTTPDLKRLLEGVWISEGRVRAKKVKRLKTHGHSTFLRIVLNEGKNREIRRMLAKLGHKVLALRRIAIGPIILGSIPSGKSRRLRGEEIEALREAAAPREAPTTPQEVPAEKPRRKKPQAKRASRNEFGESPSLPRRGSAKRVPRNESGESAGRPRRGPAKGASRNETGGPSGSPRRGPSPPLARRGNNTRVPPKRR